MDTYYAANGSAVTMRGEVQVTIDAVTLQMDFSVVFSFAWVLGLAGYIYLTIRPGQPLRSFDFVTAETASQIAVMEMIPMTTTPRSQRPLLIAQHGLKRA